MKSKIEKKIFLGGFIMSKEWNLVLSFQILSSYPTIEVLKLVYANLKQQNHSTFS